MSYGYASSTKFTAVEHSSPQPAVMTVPNCLHICPLCVIVTLGCIACSTERVTYRVYNASPYTKGQQLLSNRLFQCPLDIYKNNNYPNRSVSHPMSVLRLAGMEGVVVCSSNDKLTFRLTQIERIDCFVDLSGRLLPFNR